MIKSECIVIAFSVDRKRLQRSVDPRLRNTAITGAINGFLVATIVAVRERPLFQVDTTVLLQCKQARERKIENADT